MKWTGRFAMLAAFAGCFVLATALAQSAPPAQNQPDQNQAQSQQPVTGVSHPPADDTITADEDESSPAPAPIPKPSAAIPMTPVKPAAQPASPDNGLVTDVPESTSTTAALTKRTWNPDDDIVSYVPTNPNQLASGTNIRVRLSGDLSTEDSRTGESFSAIVDRDVYNGGRIVIPVGAQMRGHVVRVSQGHHVIGPRATIRLHPDSIVLPDGTEYHLYAEAVQSQAPGTRTDDEGGIQSAPHTKKNALEYSAGAGVGAIAGAAIAGPVGAGVGSLVGAGAVTAHMVVGHPAVANLPEGSILVFSLTEPMALTPTRATAAN